MALKRFTDPHAHECVKVILDSLDPRNPNALHGHMNRHGEVPQKYTDFDWWIGQIISKKIRSRHGSLSNLSILKLEYWRAKSYPLPLTDELREILPILPFHLGVKSLIAKDALMRQGYYQYELHADAKARKAVLKNFKREVL